MIRLDDITSTMMRICNSPNGSFAMKAKGKIKSLLLPLLLLLGVVMSGRVEAQTRVCDEPTAIEPAVEFQLTYDVGTNRYTAWYIPSDNTLHRLITGQFTIVAPNGFTDPGLNGRDVNFAITNINGAWTDFVVDNDLITGAGFAAIPSINGFAVHQVGMAPAATDVLGNTPVTAGVAIPLFSFPGKSCVSLLRILRRGEAIQTEFLNVFGGNFSNEMGIQNPRQAFQPALERYCRNAPLDTAQIVFPVLANFDTTFCTTGASYAGNFATQVLPAPGSTTLALGTILLPASASSWGPFTVSPASMSANVAINSTTGAYTINFPQSGGVVTPGSVTICSALTDSCGNLSNSACVVITYGTAGTVALTASASPVCLTGGTAVFSLSATPGFTTYQFIGPGVSGPPTASNTVSVTASSAGILSYTVLTTTGTASCTATATTTVSVTNCVVC